MKIRSGFVSNSSSSSFICVITNEEYTSMDASLEDAEMCECLNGHIFLEEFLVGEISIDLIEDEDNDWREQVPVENCPICSFTYIENDMCVDYIKSTYSISNEEVYNYMKKKNSRLRKIRPTYWFELLLETKNISKDNLIKEIKSKYLSYEEFYKNIK